MDIFFVLIIILVAAIIIINTNSNTEGMANTKYKVCRGNCQQRSPMLQKNKNILQCLNCTNCGICEYRNGYQECMPGDIYGPTNSAFSPNNCKCWYHAYGVKKYKNRRTGQIKRKYNCWPYEWSSGQSDAWSSGQPFGGSGIQRDYSGYGMTKKDAIQAMNQIREHENQTGNTTVDAGIFPWYRFRYQRDRSGGPYINE